MGLALDDDGNILINETTGLSIQREGQDLLAQDARSECRCEQGTYFADTYFGRNPLVWKLSQVPSDHIADIKNIVTKYYEPQAIGPDGEGKYLVV